MIEATIAYRKSPTEAAAEADRAARRRRKPEGVSHDENKKPPEKKDEKKPEAKPDPNDPFGEFTRPDQDTRDRRPNPKATSTAARRASRPRAKVTLISGAYAPI